MKRLILLLTFSLILFSCSSPQDKAEKAVKEFLTKQCKNFDSYESVSFLQFQTGVLDTVVNYDLMLQEYLDRVLNQDYSYRLFKTEDEARTYFKNEVFNKDTILFYRFKAYNEGRYLIRHIYKIKNSAGETIQLCKAFAFDENYNITHKQTGFDGENGSFQGNVYWKYNDYVGNKPDVGSEVTMYCKDTLHTDLKYKTEADVRGDFKFDKVLAGNYFVIVKSKNTTANPSKTITYMKIYSDNLKQLFGLDLSKFKQEFRELNAQDSIVQLCTDIIIKDNPGNLSWSSIRAKSNAAQDKKTELCKIIFESLPDNVKTKMGLFSTYDAVDFMTISVNEGQSTTKIIDFGITYL